MAVAVAVAVLAGCGTSRAHPDSVAATTRINRCIDRLLSRSTTSSASKQELRRYAKDTYCARFERHGWIYDDGALSIAAQKWLDNGGRCATGGVGQSTRTVPCEQVTHADPTLIIDCALLHHVRRTEVIPYVAALQRNRDVRCDDGTPLNDLGVP